jgi:hypothetical protein
VSDDDRTDSPGSPITPDLVFTLEGGKIAAMEIQS